MNNPIASRRRDGSLIAVVDMTASDGPLETRFDLDVIPVDLDSRLALLAASGRWQTNNNRALCERLRKQCI